jgi:hypothetical protein
MTLTASQAKQNQRRVSLIKLALPAASEFVTFGDFMDLSF